ncbi:MAG: DUF1846 domain-containing protein, partial [Clostridia bacterium]|nr:DUF1846 domain-containing protein [Clostridia bacterium]
MSIIGFDNEEYIKKQSEQIAQRISEFGGKLYLEFGGKLFDDYHASRVLPGFKPDSKLQMLKNIAKDVEIVIVISSCDIENMKIRRDIGISYDNDVLRLIDAFREFGLYVGSVVISKYQEQPAAAKFRERLESLGIKTYLHYPIAGYPYDVNHVVSNEGLGSNEYIETERPLVVVTAPGPGSGKMATCLSQLYHENERGIKAGYAKFETFPIWNIPLKHPLNLAYEAATADLDDVNMIDPYHLEAYGKTAVNYNRDVEVFPVLNAIFERIKGESPYKSPTDMGVNMVGNCIINDDVVSNASRQEIVRRYFAALCDQRDGKIKPSVVGKIEVLMKQANATLDDRKSVKAAINRSIETNNQPAVAIELTDGTIVTGKTSQLLGAASAALLNAVKVLAGLPKETMMIAPETIEPIQTLKVKTLGNHNPRLHTDEALIALAISASTDNIAQLAMEQLEKLRGCRAHSTVIL